MLFLALNINVSYAQYKKINFIPSISIDDNNFSESSTLQYTSKIVKEKENNTIYFNWIIKEKSPCFFILEKSFDGGYNYIELRVLIKDKDINIDEPIFYCYNEENKNDVSNILFRLKQINYDQIGNIIFFKKVIIYSPELVTYDYKLSPPVNKKTINFYNNPNILNSLFFHNNEKNNNQINIININDNNDKNKEIEPLAIKNPTFKKPTKKVENIIIFPNYNNNSKYIIVKVKKNKFKCFLISLFDFRIFKKDKNKYNPNKKPVKTNELTGLQKIEE